MLVLTRKPGQKILIGNDIVVHIGEVKRGSHVKVAIDAPQHVNIVRGEVIARINQQESEDDDDRTKS